MVMRSRLGVPPPLAPGEEVAIAPAMAEVRGRTRRSRRGFALLDVVIAGIIIGIALAGIIGLTGRSLSAQARGEELQTAAMLADEYLSLVLARGPDGYARSYSTTGECDAPFSKFNYLINFSGGSVADPFRVTVTITWPSGAGGATRELSLETLIASREGDDPDPERKPPENTNRLQ